MYYIIYKITNVINNKIYIGYHSTFNINDDYMGSGKLIKNAIKKYGRSNFSKEVLHIFNNREDALIKELELVNEDFIKSNDNYNLKIGGEGGWDYINELRKNNPQLLDSMKNKCSIKIKYLYEIGILKNDGINNPMYGKAAWNKGLSLSDEHKNNISKNNGNKLQSGIISERLNDLMLINKNRGYISELSKRWNISHTQVKRFIKKYN